MRIIMANRYFIGYLGGVERYIASLAAELGRLGVDVIICAAGADQLVRFEGLPVRTVPSLAQLRAFIAQGADVVHGHLPRNPFSYEAIRASHKAGIRTVFTPHAFYPDGSVLKKFAKRLTDLTMTRHTMKICDAVVNLTPQDQADSVRHGLVREKSVIIPNSVSVRELMELEDKSQNAPSPFKQPYILHVGRFHRVKNIPFLVQAHRRITDHHLVLIGQDDGELPMVRALIAELGLEERVHILERADRNVVVAAYMNASAVVLSSRWEGLPTVLLEAMFFRKPFVASDVGGNDWLVKRGAPGRIFTLDDEDGYVSSLASACRIDANTLGDGRTLVADEFSWETNAQRMLHIYSQRT